MTSIKFGRGISPENLLKSMGLTEEDLKPCCQNGHSQHVEPMGDKNKHPRNPDEIDPTRTAAAKKEAIKRRAYEPTTSNGHKVRKEHQKIGLT